MPSDVRSILNLEVPVLVLLGERRVRVAEVTSWFPGAIVELPKQSEEELQILVNNKVVGTGVAVKVGENFGVRVTYIGDLKNRIQALGAGDTVVEPDADDASAPSTQLIEQA
jgi:flagellar motor switch protein FliN/FliY